MRSLVLVLLLAAASALSAQTAYPLGSGEIVPIAAHKFNAARSGNEVLAVWSAFESAASYFGRFDFEGNRAGEVAPIVTNDAPCSDPQIATSPRETLILCSAGSLQTMRITDDGFADANEVAAEGVPVALRWSGREFVALIRNADATHAMLRLDRDGRAIGGSILLRSAMYATPSIACGDTRCMVAFTDERLWGQVAKDRVRIAIVGESDYPAAGESRVLPLTYFLSARGIALGFDDLGFYSVTVDEKLILRRHGRLRSASSPDLRDARQLVIAGGGSSRVFTDSEGSEIYVANEYSGPDSRALIYGISPSGVRVVRDPATDQSRRAAAVVALPSSAFVFWRFLDDRQFLRLSAVSGSVVRTTNEIVTRGVASEVLPRLARGTNALLATWVEEGETDSLFGAMIDRQGRPLSAPVRIATAELGAIHDAAIAFDGDRFLVIWRSGNPYTTPVHGRFLSQNGELASERLEWPIDPMWLTLVWTGKEYSASDDRGQVTISSTGQLLGDNGRSEGVLAPDEWGELVGLTYTIESTIFGAGPNLLARYCLGSSYTCPSGKGVASVAPAMALGDGDHAVAIYYSSGWDYGLFLHPNTRLPYDVWDTYRTERLHAHWTGTDFVVGSGATFSRHAPDGTLLSQFSMGSDVIDVAVIPDDPGAMIVLRERGRRVSSAPDPSGSIDVLRMSIPAN